MRKVHGFVTALMIGWALTEPNYFTCAMAALCVVYGIHIHLMDADNG